MYPHQFRKMLRTLNPDIIFHESNNNAYRTGGVYLKEDNGYGSAKFLFGCNMDWIPDRTQFDMQTHRIVRRGWKDSVVQLHRMGHVRNRDYYMEITRGWGHHRL